MGRYATKAVMPEWVGTNVLFCQGGELLSATTKATYTVLQQYVTLHQLHGREIRLYFLFISDI